MDDDDFVEVPSKRIFGIGYGTFAILMFFLFLVFIWLITDPITRGIKWFWRFLTFILCLIGFLLLVFAERANRYEGQGAEIKVFQ